MKISARAAATSGVASLAVIAMLSGCASAPDAPSGSATTTDFLPCMVSDLGGFDDHSFNQLGYEGLIEAAKAIGAKTKTVESNAETEYADNINSLVTDGCDLIVTVGFALSAATVTAALANPDVEFAIIDDAADNDFNGKTDAPNIKPILFDTAQAAFLVGYAAADFTKTGVLGTYGGMNFPTVSIFMDGFKQGADYYAKEKGKDVKVLGWNLPDGSDATFIGTFSAGTESLGAANNLIQQNADVLLPVGGPIYQSAGEAINDSGKDVALVGVDADLFVTDPNFAELYLTSILKGIKVATSDVVKAAGDGKFDVTPYIGTLENDGVGYAPFHDFESKISSTLPGELDALKAKIISGDIVVKSYLAG